MRKIIIHGGCSLYQDVQHLFQDYRKEFERIIKQGYQVLCEKSAEEAVVDVISALEDCPIFDAGTGSKIQADGKIRMTAGLMRGDSRVFSGVLNIQKVKNPIQVAQTLQDKEYPVLAGIDSTRYARRSYFLYHNPSTEHRVKEYKSKQGKKGGTVGAVAVDDSGIIVTGTSTGGNGYETPGRVSDSATVAGTYASENVGISCTGIGEDIVSDALAAKTVTRIDDGMKALDALNKSLDEGNRRNRRYGFILLTSQGESMVAQTEGTITAYSAYDGVNLEMF